MAAPSLITELSQTAGSNGPAGSVSPIELDNYDRAHASFIAQLRDGKGHAATASVASATTTDIGAANSLSVEITGTTTITGFGTAYSGPRLLRFAGALTLTDSASLSLPGAANITAAAGDTCIAVPNLAANGWNVVSYQRAAALPAVSGANTDITSLGAASSFALSGNTQLTFSTTAADVAFGGAAYGSPGVSLNASRNISFSNGTGTSYATVFQQASNASLVLGDGVRWTATANGFASSIAASWAHAAVEVGNNGIKFYHNAAASVAAGTDITMQEQVRFVNGGLQYSRIPTFSGMYSQYMCRAWAHFTTSGGTVSFGGGGNVGSITDNGVGDFTANFAVALPDALYSFAGNAGNVSAGTNPYVVTENSRTTSSIRFNVFWVTNGAVDPAVCSIAIHR